MKKWRLPVYLILLAASSATAACLPSALIENTIRHISLISYAEASTESSAARGNQGDMIVRRLSRPYYTITIVHTTQPVDTEHYLLGRITADTRVLDGSAGKMQQTSFMAKKTKFSLELLCTDKSILSDTLLHSEIHQILQRTKPQAHHKGKDR